MPSIIQAKFRAGSAAALLLLLGSGSDQHEPPALLPADQGATLTVELSAYDAGIGEQVTVAIRQGADLVGLEGRFTFDPERLAYVGQRAFDVVVAEDRSGPVGALHVSAASCGSLPHDAAILLFEVRAPNYTEGIAFHLDRARASGRVARADAAGQPDAATSGLNPACSSGSVAQRVSRTAKPLARRNSRASGMVDP